MTDDEGRERVAKHFVGRSEVWQPIPTLFSVSTFEGAAPELDKMREALKELPVSWFVLETGLEK